MDTDKVIIIINLIVIIGVIYSVYRYRYDKKLIDSKLKNVLYWLGIALILFGNISTIIYFLYV